MLSGGQKLAYCLANVAAILTALWIAMWLDLERPYWAMFTVFIVSKPVSGAVRAKSVYRFLGTLTGAAMAVFLVPPLVQSPVLLSLAISLWVGACLFASLMDRTPRSYAFILAGYTVAIIAFPSVNAPTAIFDIAVARLEEISIGIVCAAVAHSVFFPHSLESLLCEKAKVALKLSAALVAKALHHTSQGPSTADIAKLGSVVTEIHTLYTQIGFDTSNVRHLPVAKTALLDHLATVLPNVSLVTRAITRMEQEHLVDTEMRARLDEMANAIELIMRGEISNITPLRSQATTHSVGDGESSSESGTALEQLLFLRVGDLITTLMECRYLLAILSDEKNEDIPQLSGGSPSRPLYRDYGLATLSMGTAIVATLVACAIWIETSWPEGFVAAELTAVCCSLFATVDRPAEILGKAVVGIVAAFPIAALYQFAILPGIDGFPSLALALAPMMFAFSYLQTNERLEGAAMVLAIAFSADLSLQETYAGNFATFSNVSLAIACGPLLAAAMLLVFRTIDPLWNAKRILRSGRAAVGELARSRWKNTKAWMLQMVDRAGLAAIRLAPTASTMAEEDVVRDLRIGLNIASLLQLKDAFGRPWSAGIARLMALVGQIYTDERQVRPKPTDDEIRSIFVDLMTTLSSAAPSQERLEGQAALTGLRLDLDLSQMTMAAAA